MGTLSATHCITYKSIFKYHFHIALCIHFRDQDGDTNDLDENSKLSIKSNISSNDRLQGGKSMSIMNTQQKDKSDQTSNQRNVSTTLDSNRSSSFVNAPIPASVSSNVTNSSNTNSSINSTNTSSTASGSTLDSASVDTQIPTTNAGNTTQSAQGREQK